MSRAPPGPDDAELDELPPLDGETGESSDADATVDELDEDPSEATLDDSTGEDDALDPNELPADLADEGSWIDEAADSADLDLGDVGLLELSEDTALDDADEASPADEDLGFAETPGHRAGLDAGDEGPVDPDEELRDEDLPALDADEEGEPSDAGFVDERFASDEPLGLPWAAVPWTRVGAPLALFGATAIACAGRGALVCARLDSSADRARVVHVDLEGARHALDAEGLDGTDVQSLAAGGPEGQVVEVVQRGGRLAVSADGGARFEPRAEGAAVADAAIASGALWLRTRAGALLTSRDDDRSLGRCPLSGVVVAIAADREALVALVVDEDRRPAALVRAVPGAAIVREAIEAPEVRASALLASRAGYVAYPGRNGVVRRGPEGVWRSSAWEGRVTALAFVDDAGTLLVASYSDADDTTGLVRLGAAGDASIVARIGALRDEPRSDGRALGMAFDDAHGVVWLAGGFGVAVFAMAPPETLARIAT